MIDQASHGCRGVYGPNSGGLRCTVCLQDDAARQITVGPDTNTELGGTLRLVSQYVRSLVTTTRTEGRTMFYPL